MQNLILLAVIVGGFFYALYRTYLHADGEGGGCSGCSGSCMSCPLSGGCTQEQNGQKQ